MPIIEDLIEFREELLHQKSFLLFIRHAEKVINPEEPEDVHVPLSKKGILQSQEFGKKLEELFGKIEIGVIKTSPIQRCISTAQNIINRQHCETPIIPSKILGDPGVFVADDQLAYQNFIDLGVKQVIEALYAEKTLAGMRTIKEGVQLLLNEMNNDLKNCDGMIIYITHDAILIPFIKFFIEEFEYTNNLIDYLNGIIFLINKTHEYSLLWEGKRHTINQKIKSCYPNFKGGKENE